MNVLIIMQGAPGSGKTTVAKTIQKAWQCSSHLSKICSTDDLFMVDGVYKFDPTKLGEYHVLNQKRVRHTLEWGESVIVDNTNLQAWEAKPYVQMAQELGVPVFFVPCYGNFQNTHGVPQEKVDHMRARMETLSVEACLAAKAPWEK